jgi:hypothetical protein
MLEPLYIYALAAAAGAVVANGFCIWRNTVMTGAIPLGALVAVLPFWLGNSSPDIHLAMRSLLGLFVYVLAFVAFGFARDNLVRR